MKWIDLLLVFFYCSLCCVCCQSQKRTNSDFNVFIHTFGNNTNDGEKIRKEDRNPLKDDIFHKDDDKLNEFAEFMYKLKGFKTENDIDKVVIPPRTASINRRRNSREYFYLKNLPRPNGRRSNSTSGANILKKFSKLLTSTYSELYRLKSEAEKSETQKKKRKRSFTGKRKRSKARRRKIEELPLKENGNNKENEISSKENELTIGGFKIISERQKYAPPGLKGKKKDILVKHKNKELKKSRKRRIKLKKQKNAKALKLKSNFFETSYSPTYVLAPNNALSLVETGVQDDKNRPNSMFNNANSLLISSHNIEDAINRPKELGKLLYYIPVNNPVLNLQKKDHVKDFYSDSISDVRNYNALQLSKKLINQQNPYFFNPIFFDSETKPNLLRRPRTYRVSTPSPIFYDEIAASPKLTTISRRFDVSSMGLDPGIVHSDIPLKKPNLKTNTQNPSNEIYKMKNTLKNYIAGKIFSDHYGVSDREAAQIPKSENGNDKKAATESTSQEHLPSFPTYSEVPKTLFNCNNKLTGYYADPQAECQVFHMCQTKGRKDSFLCPNGTLFNQLLLTCDHFGNVDCSLAEKHYQVNSLLYKKKNKLRSLNQKNQRISFKSSEESEDNFVVPVWTHPNDLTSTYEVDLATPQPQQIQKFYSPEHLDLYKYRGDFSPLLVNLKPHVVKSYKVKPFVPKNSIFSPNQI